MSSAPTLSRYAWTVVALLFPVALLNYLDRQMIASMKVSVMGDITDIGGEELGAHAGVLQVGVCHLQPDRRLHRRPLQPSADHLRQPVRVVARCTWLTGHVSNFQELYWARAAMGISEEFTSPPALALIPDFHTGSTRSRAVGVHQMGIYCGVMIGGRHAGYAAESPALGSRTGLRLHRPRGHSLRAALAAAAAGRTPQHGGRPAMTASHPSLPPGVSCSRICRSSCSCSTSRCPRLPPGWCAELDARHACKRSLTSARAKAGVLRRALLAAGPRRPSSAAGSPRSAGCTRRRVGASMFSAIGMLLIIPALFGVGNAPALGSFTLLPSLR